MSKFAKRILNDWYVDTRPNLQKLAPNYQMFLSYASIKQKIKSLLRLLFSQQLKLFLITSVYQVRI